MKRRERKQTVKNALSTLLTDSNRSTSSSVDPSSADLDDVTCIQEKSSVDSKVYGQVYRRLTVLSCICYASTVFTIFMLFNDKVPDPYMDEPFHVNQAQAYCAGNFTYWNSKITTPPGLYFVSVLLIAPVNLLQTSIGPYILDTPPVDLCSLTSLRFVNLLFSFGNVYIVYFLSHRMHSSCGAACFKALFSTFSLVTFPPLFFFNFLYYTDVGSVFFVLLMLWFEGKNNRLMAAFSGFISLFFRQNNIIWIFMMAAHYTLKRAITHHKINIFEFNGQLRQNLFNLAKHILHRCSGYVFCGIFFLLFVVINQGIVLGDRQAHVMVAHFAQVPYFFGFALMFGWPYMLHYKNLLRLHHIMGRYIILFFICCAFMWTAINHFAYVHPYLLADNRHYSFYFWRRGLDVDHSIRNSHIMIYSFSLFVFFTSIHQRDLSFVLVFLFSIFALLVPTHLFEFRYFVLPFLIWRIHVLPSSLTTIAVEFTFNTFINCLIIYIFLFCPFRWDHEPNLLQRFMW